MYILSPSATPHRFGSKSCRITSTQLDRATDGNVSGIPSGDHSIKAIDHVQIAVGKYGFVGTCSDISVRTRGMANYLAQVVIRVVKEAIDMTIELSAVLGNNGR